MEKARMEQEKFMDNNLYKILRCPFSTLSQRSSLSYRNQSTDLLCKPIKWFLYDRDLSHKRVENIFPHTEDISSARENFGNSKAVMSIKKSQQKNPDFQEVSNFIFKGRRSVSYC